MMIKGNTVWNLAHPLSGEGDVLSCDALVHATVCCGWRGYLRDGWWIPEE